MAVNAYVLADDGLYYRNPSLEGPTWFLAFHPDEQPEFCLLMKRREGRPDAVRRALAILNEIGVDTDCLPDPALQKRYFSSPHNATLDCWQWFADVRRPIPRVFLPADEVGLRAVPADDNDGTVWEFHER